MRRGYLKSSLTLYPLKNIPKTLAAYKARLKQNKNVAPLEREQFHIGIRKYTPLIRHSIVTKLHKKSKYSKLNLREC